MAKAIEIRWHARGGQGAVLASRFLAASALRENKWFQAFPQFGTERMGAPIVAYTRVDSEPINLRCAIERPDVVAVMDPTLLGVVDVTANLKDGGALVVNHPGTPADVRKKLGIEGKNIKVYTVDATKISTEELGRPMPNTPMVGALTKITGAVDIKNVTAEFAVSFGARFKKEVVDKNLKAIERAFAEVNAE